MKAILSFPTRLSDECLESRMAPSVILLSFFLFSSQLPQDMGGQPSRCEARLLGGLWPTQGLWTYLCGWRTGFGYSWSEPSTPPTCSGLLSWTSLLQLHRILQSSGSISCCYLKPGKKPCSYHDSPMGIRSQGSSVKCYVISLFSMIGTLTECHLAVYLLGQKITKYSCTNFTVRNLWGKGNRISSSS